MCVCEGDIESLSRRGLPREKLHLHINGVDRPKISSESRSEASRTIQARWRGGAPGLPENALVLGAVARLSGEKRHDRMLRALAVARQKLAPREAVLVCFGVGGEETKLKALTAELGLEKAAFWMGYSKTAGQDMAGFDLLLCLSDGEGIPINLLEAGWAATPVFSTRVGGIPDVISSSAVGYLVDKSQSDEEIGTRIAEVLADAAGRAETGRRYQQHIEKNFSEKAWLDRLREVYGKLG
jgi:glycosyltransferase involved in cell wall biosynthesis